MAVFAILGLLWLGTSHVLLRMRVRALERAIQQLTAPGTDAGGYRTRLPRPPEVREAAEQTANAGLQLLTDQEFNTLQVRVQDRRRADRSE